MGQSPGSISRWMAIPWQTDTASCRSGYDTSYDPYVPTFWPARVPNEVMSETAYALDRLLVVSFSSPLPCGKKISFRNTLNPRVYRT